MLILKLDPEEVMRDGEVKREFLSWAMSDNDFLESFVELLAIGVSPENSWPGRLDAIREAFHKAAGDEYLADAMRRVQDANHQRRESDIQKDAIERRLKEAAELLPRVFQKDGVFALKHGSQLAPESCDACRFVRCIKGDEKMTESQPMSTAPKDGTRVMAFWLECGWFCPTRFDDDRFSKRPKPFWS